MAQKNDDVLNDCPKKDLSDKVSVTQNILYGNDKNNNVFDFCYPKNTDKKLPTIIVLHGGGYVGGKKENTFQYAKQLASRGFCVLNLEYCRCDGLDKKHFIDQVTDFYDFFDYIKHNKEICEKIDFDNLFLSGDSAGGHLAQIVASIQSNKLLDANSDFLNGPKVKGVILISPIFGPFKMLNLPLEPLLSPMVYGTKRNYDLFGKQKHGFDVLSKEFPPTIMFSAKNDFLTVGHKKEFLKQAKKVGFPLLHYTITKAHKLFHSSMIKYCDHYENCLDKVAYFVKNLSMGKQIVGVKDFKIAEDERSTKKNNQQTNDKDLWILKK